jgi:hypothetical protein
MTEKTQKAQYINWSAGTWPWYQDMLRARITQGFNTIMCFVGSAGMGKSYGALSTGEEMDPTFDINRVTFFANEFIRVTQEMGKGQYVQLDEPALAGILGKRTWYAEVQQALVDVMETFRFKNLTVMLCCINRNLLDTIVRNYLLHYMVIMENRGYGKVYSINPSQFDSTVRTPLEGEIFLELPSKELREAYEEKRRKIQNSRYIKSLNNMENMEAGRRTFTDVLNEAKEKVALLTVDGKISIAKIREILKVGRNQASDIHKILEHPNEDNHV